MARWLFPLFVLPALVVAQTAPGRGPRPWWDSHISRDLNLTDAQTKQIQSTQQEFRPRMLELRAAVNKAESDLQTVFDEDPVDQHKASDAIDRLAAARSELTKAVSQMDLRFRMVLTAQQWQQLQQRQRPPRLDRPPGRRRTPASGSGPSSTSSLKQ